ncbi:hypothetical protein ACF0H5_008413 [Mactra antiquata]
MVTADLSSNQHLDAVLDKQEAIGASQHSHSVNNNICKYNHTDFKYVNVGNQANGSRDNALEQKLQDDPETAEKMFNLWHDVEHVMGQSYSRTCKVLETYGIGDGEEDSETEEGQLWRMVQGDAPYTLNLT